MKFYTFSVLFLIISCAQYPKKDTVNPVPSFYTMAPKLNSKIKKISRSIASTKKQDNLFANYNNKTLYFISLYKQYNKLVSYSDSVHPGLNTCPRFHNTFLDFKSTPGKIDSSWKDKLLSFKNITPEHHPELLLSDEGVSLLDKNPNIAKQSLNEGLDNHIEGTYKELNRFCKTGISHNYFIFENLITYMKNNPGFRSGENALTALMKTTLYSNLYLLKSLALYGNKRTLASEETLLEEEVLFRLNASWSKSFFKFISRARKVSFDNV